MNEIEVEELSSLSSDSHFGDRHKPDDTDNEVV
jgi:hypothetical protein